MDATHPPPKLKYLNKDKISRLPKNPGVYAFKKGREFLYIGKAANLKERVKNHDELLSLAKQLGYIKTNSEIEALILEANLIKKYQPKYNVVWRDDKNYFFVEVTKEDFPQVFWTHQTRIKNKESRIKNIFIGPYVDGKALKQTLKILRKVFPYRSCKALPKRPCLWYQLKRCPAPCALKTKLGAELPTAQIKMKKECQQNAKNLIKILQGKKKQVLKELKNEMKKVVLTQDFEKAAKIRDQVGALERVISHAKIFEPQLLISPDWEITQKVLQKILKIKNKISRIEAYDISNIQGQEATGSMVTFIDGKPDKNFYRRFKIHPIKSLQSKFNGVKIVGKPNDVAMIKEVLSRRLKHQEWPFPDLILIDGGIGQLNAALRIKNQESRIKNKIKVMALAKRKNELFIEGEEKPLLLKSLPREVFNLILQLLDEAHRFAISYHKKLRRKVLFGN